MKRLNLMLMIGALLLAALACSLPGQNTTETPEPVVPTDAPTEAVTEEVTEAPTEAPTDEGYTCAPGMVPGYAFTVEFCYPSAYVTGFNQALIAEVAPDPNLAPWDYNPDMIELNFNGVLRDYQQEAADRVLERMQGVLEASTGAGKTVCALAIIAAIYVSLLGGH